MSATGKNNSSPWKSHKHGHCGSLEVKPSWGDNAEPTDTPLLQPNLWYVRKTENWATTIKYGEH